MKWNDAKKKKPENGKFVLSIVNGRFKQISFKNAPVIAEYYDDEGWIIEGYEEAVGLRVDFWMEIPPLEEKPLTLEELMQRDGKPVYIVEEGRQGWELAEDASEYFLEREAAEYGQSWFAYEREPEEVRRE